MDVLRDWNYCRWIETVDGLIETVDGLIERLYMD